jgi:CheY-like chemotaxis protein
MTPRVLIVEDESLLVMVLEDLLPDLGYQVAATANSVESALQVLDAQAIDLAILDINLAGEASFPIADALAARGVPFVFATGYGANIVPPQHAAVPLTQKPFGRRDLEQALSLLQLREGAST